MLDIRMGGSYIRCADSTKSKKLASFHQHVKIMLHTFKAHTFLYD